jgi:hypothetical protein
MTDNAGFVDFLYLRCYFQFEGSRVNNYARHSEGENLWSVFYQVEFGLKRKRSHPVVRTTYLEGHIQPP